MSEPCQTVPARSRVPGAAPARVLFVDGDRRLLSAVFAALEPRGFALDAAGDGRTGLALARTGAGEHDVLVVARSLARLDGLSLLRRLRDDGLDVPVLVLSADDDLGTRLAAFDAGADDCLGKPFAVAELEARLRALVRRRRPAGTSLRVGDLHYDVATGEIRRGARTIRLFRGPRALLERLMRESPAIVPKDRLEAVLWGDERPDRDLLRTHVWELRRRIDGPGDVPLLHTAPGIGYRLAVPAQERHETRTGAPGGNAF